MPITVYNIFNVTGSTTDFQYTFDVLGSFSDVVVKWQDSLADAFTTMTEGSESEGGDYTHDTATKTISFHVARESGDIVRIERNTNREREVDYEGGSTLTEDNLDDDANRLTSVDQEIESDLTDALRKDETGSYWDGEGLRSSNCSPATTTTGWVTYAQAEALIAGGQPTIVDAASVLTFTGDGTTTEFELENWSGLTTEYIWVHVDNVYQEADGNTYSVINEDESLYPSAGTGWDYLSFDTAPPDGASIEVKIVQGTVVAQLLSGSVTGDMIQNNAINLRHLNFGGGVDKRFLVIDTAGDPAARVAVHTDINDFDAGVRANRLNEMTAPDGAVSMSTQKLTNLGAATASSDAVRLDQLAFAKAKKGSLGTIHVFSVDPDIISLNWEPDIVIVTGDINIQGEGTRRGSWTWLNPGTNDAHEILAGGEASNLFGHCLKFQRVANDGFKVGWVHDNNAVLGSHITAARYLAMKI